MTFTQSSKAKVCKYEAAVRMFCDCFLDTSRLIVLMHYALKHRYRVNCQVWLLGFFFVVK